MGNLNSDLPAAYLQCFNLHHHIHTIASLGDWLAIVFADFQIGNIADFLLFASFGIFSTFAQTRLSF